jgi:uncharacterized protein with gpF-like domain
MPDYGRQATDAEYKRLRRRVVKIYQQAYKDIAKKAEDFMKKHEAKEKMLRQQLADGKIAQADFDAWMRGQVFQGKQWEAKRKQMEATLLHADEMAMDMINGSRLRVFADNANYIGYEIEQHGKIQTSFGLYDINSVKRLLMEEPDLLPPRKVGKDASYQWYNKQIQGAVTQGIIQGEPLTDIAKRIGQATGERCMNAMLRNARTMHTGAECAGRIEGMHQAQKLGIEVKKQWLATLDGHTRDAHRDLDGQVRDVDKPFDSSMGKIRFPGDATAFPGLVWNCRCTLIYVYPKYPDSMTQRRDNITGEVIEDMTYREWERMKREEGATEPIAEPVVEPDADNTNTERLFASAMQGASNAAEFWMNMDAEQMETFNASGENIYDLYNRLKDSMSVEALELPEWKPDAPGGIENYTLYHDYSGHGIQVNEIAPRSEGWMAGAETTGIINVRNGGFDEWRYIIGHEAGHQLANYNPELQRIIVDNPGGLLGKYNQKRGFFDGAFGEYNAEEAWADAVSAYVNSPQNFSEQYPKLYRAVDSFFKTSPSALDFVNRALASYRKAVGK